MTVTDDTAHGSFAVTKALQDLCVEGLETCRPSILNEIPEEKAFGGNVKEINKADENTKDDWVPRHRDMIRLTGRHPFNSEPPPARMMESYITPAPLHYVRNHGAVPQIAWEQHRLQVNGLVSNPHTFTMDEIVAMPAVDVTCTLTCAGNRRKEQNMVKKSIGFNWGPAGTGCSTWTGVRLVDVLVACGVNLSGKAQHIRMRGPKGELPAGKDGSYGTSITIDRATNPAFDVILAYKQNGELLTPDHGYPLRVIIPGYIGGRMIKWIEEITVTKEESDNHYHYHDNRVLPAHVDEALANKEGWWYKPDFIINDLNINSAIISPGHDEALPLTAGSTVQFSGYAYANGNRIIRCELSIDDGKTWRLADITRRTKPNTFGRSWAWVWWEIDVPFADLLGCPEVICRAWDSCMNTQPNTFTWNVMGMMNNCVYRVKLHPQACPNGRFMLQFEHPIIAGPTVGGWMNRAHQQEAVGAVPASSTAFKPPAISGNGRVITMAELEKHDSAESAWFVIEGQVYDATPFLKDHPGGADSILLVAGTDATDEFNAIHSTKAKAMLKDYYIGDLEGAQAPVDGQATANGHNANGINEHINDDVKAAELVALNPKKRIPFALVEKEELSHNVRRFRFGLQSPQHRFGLPVGKHVFLYANVNDKLVMRAYTPTSSDDDLGYFDLVVKIYRANEHPRFPAGGAMSQHLEAMAIGDTIDVKGPVGHMHYLGCGRYTLDNVKHVAKRFNMIAGGTGITPVYQVIKSILKNAVDTTEIACLYGNQTPSDVLLQDELDALAAAYPNFKVHYTVDRLPDDEQWEYSLGHINNEMVEQQLFPASKDTISLMCGPPPMLKFAVIPALEGVGFANDQMIQF